MIVRSLMKTKCYRDATTAVLKKSKFTLLVLKFRLFTRPNSIPTELLLNTVQSHKTELDYLSRKRFTSSSHSLSFYIMAKKLAPFNHPIRCKTRPIVTRSHRFSQLHALCFMIGQGAKFGFGFTALN